MRRSAPLLIAGGIVAACSPPTQKIPDLRPGLYQWTLREVPSNSCWTNFPPTDVSGFQLVLARGADARIHEKWANGAFEPLLPADVIMDTTGTLGVASAVEQFAADPACSVVVTFAQTASWQKSEMEFVFTFVDVISAATLNADGTLSRCQQLVGQEIPSLSFPFPFPALTNPTNGSCSFSATGDAQWLGEDGPLL
jgi:hypothetical protein